MATAGELSLQNPTATSRSIPVSDSNPVPVKLIASAAADATVVGPTNITTQNLVPTGAATPNSAVELTCFGRDTAVIQVTGVYTGALSVQGTLNGTDWVTIGGVPLQRLSDGTQNATIASAATGLWAVGVGGFVKIRVTALAAVTGTATVTLNAIEGNALVALDAALPTGTNTIGNIGTIATSITPGTAAANLGKAEDAVHASGDTGVMALAVANTNAATAFGASGDYTPIAVDVNGAIFVKPKPALTNGTPAAFALAANTSTSILAANAARRKALIVNRSGQTVFIRIGAAVTSSLYTWELAQGEKWELPEGITGQVFALSTLAGSAVAAGVGLFVTEFTD